MEDADVEEITAPSQTKTWSVLLTPVERPVPKTNPFSTSHPGVPLRHAIRIKLSPELSYYVENRQTPFTSSTYGTSRYDSDIPATGVIVTDAADRDSSKLFRVFVTLATGYNDPLNTAGETWTYYLNATKRVEVKVVEAIGSNPAVYRVDVTWGDVPPATGTDFDYRIRDWTPPPWESPDIWVDTKVDNAWDVYKHSDATKNPFVTGHPVLNGDRLRAKWESRLYARVWNDGNVAKNDVVVKFQVVLPVAMGPSPGMDIGERKINLPAGGSAVTPALKWAPMDVENEHLCIRAFVVPDPKEKSHQNNLAQENFADWYVEKSSPYRPIRFPFQVTNPLSRRALILMRARGLVPGFNLTVEPYHFWLEEGETIHGEAELAVEDWVMTEDAMYEEEQQAPVVSLEAMAKRGCTYVPFGGVSGIAHTVRRAELDMDVDPAEEAIYVSGSARTADGPIAGARVAVRIVGRDQMEELAFDTATTASDGRYSEELPVPRGGPNGDRFVEAVLAPTLGTGPAEVGALPIPLP